MIQPKEGKNYLLVPTGEGLYFLGHVLESSPIAARLNQVSWVAWLAEGGDGAGPHTRAMTTGVLDEVEPHDPEAETIVPVLAYTWHEWKHALPTEPK